MSANPRTFVENSIVEVDEGVNERLQRLENALRANQEALKECQERLFLAELELSSSFESNLSTVQSDAYHGGAVFDEASRKIISVSRGSNSCRDLFVTQLASPTVGVTGKWEKMIPFCAFYGPPVYDGCRFVYFFQYPDEQNRFGRYDVQSNTFEELEKIPGDHFASPFSGCFHHGVVYTLDCRDQLCGYDVARKEWFRSGITLPTYKSGTATYGHLLSDPRDARHLYYLAVKDRRNLIRIGLDNHSLIEICKLPWNSWLYNTILVRNSPESEDFVIITSIEGGSWFMYSSKTNSWKSLSKWKKADTSGAQLRYLVYTSQFKTFYYHIRGSTTWEMVRL